MDAFDHTPSAIQAGSVTAPRRRGRPLGSRNKQTMTGPVPDSILVHYNGRLGFHQDGWMKYDGGNMVFIYLRDRTARFDYIDLCRAIMGRLTKPNVNGLMCMGTVMDEWPEDCHSITIRPIQSDEDVAYLLGKHLAVYYQDTYIDYNIVEGTRLESYRIPEDIHAMWKPSSPDQFLSMWNTAEAREREELASLRNGVTRPWYFSHSEDYERYTLRHRGNQNPLCDELE